MSGITYVDHDSGATFVHGHVHLRQSDRCLHNADGPTCEAPTDEVTRLRAEVEALRANDYLQVASMNGYAADLAAAESERDQLRAELGRVKGLCTARHIDHSDVRITEVILRAESAEAERDQLAETLELRSRALNETGASNDQLRAELADANARLARVTEQLRHECPHGDMSWSGVDQTPLDDPAKGWICDNCGKLLDAEEAR